MSLKRRLIISSDSVGRWGDFEDWLSVWGWMRELEQFEGLEVLAWRDRLSRFVSTGAKMGVAVSGVHGRLGGGEGGVWRLVESMLLDTGELLDKYAGGDGYVLLHADEAEQASEKIVCKRKVGDQFVLMLENGTGERQVAKVVELSKKYGAVSGMRVGVMFDLYHYFGSLSGNLRERWSATLARLERLFGEVELVSLHLPIGTRLDDSLPVKEMALELWQDLASVIDGRVGQVTIENQQRGLSVLRVMGASIVKQRDRNKRVMEKLLKAGVV